ncbi:hypothetical protein [Glutamicibacter uratoxydans]|uniref:hypothetical protein n=1 Tax=Glutamicibacter uratoxydans TaxID=43667 RepID=UPI003D6DEB3D
MKPKFQVRRYEWINKATQERVDGIGLLRRGDGRVVGHLTPAQARAIADKLHDLADELEAEHEPASSVH